MYYVIVGQSKSGAVYIQGVQVQCALSDWALGERSGWATFHSIMELLSIPFFLS